MSNPNGADLAANAARALDHYSALLLKLGTEIETLQAQQVLIREFLGALMATPRTRKPRVVEDAPVEAPEPDPAA
jgi:hypothetical protein